MRKKKVIEELEQHQFNLVIGDDCLIGVIDKVDEPERVQDFELENLTEDEDAPLDAVSSAIVEIKS